MQQTVPPRRQSRPEVPPLTAGQVAQRAGCSRVTVWRAIDRGELEAYRLGARGTYRVRPEAVEAWLQPARTPAPTKENAR
jgi:excisionase family DNA binding protein